MFNFRIHGNARKSSAITLKIIVDTNIFKEHFLRNFACPSLWCQGRKHRKNSHNFRGPISFIFLYVM